MLCGSCLAIVEGEEVRLRTWDVLPCPEWTRHGFKSDTGAGVEAYTTEGDIAYAGTPDHVVEAYRSGTLPGA